MKLSDLIDSEFYTTDSASKKNDDIANRLGTHRYGPARLALALSLADKKALENEAKGTSTRGIRGRQLLGDDANMASWVALITEHAGRELSRQEFNTAIAMHWERGINILSNMWKGAEGDFDKFIGILSEKSGLPVGNFSPSPQVNEPHAFIAPDGVNLHIGNFLSGDTRGERAEWRINASGHPPHIAIMGASGGGKTRLAFRFIEEVTSQTGCAAFIFDMKGDIADNSALIGQINANVIDCPGSPVPLDILHVADRKNNTLVQNAAARFCDSLACAIPQGGKGSVQMDRLRQVAVQEILRKDRVSMSDLRRALTEHYREEDIKDDSIIAALNRLCDFNLFSPEQSPSEFFKRSWVFVMNNAADEIRRFSALVILDVLNRYFVGLPEVYVDENENRQITAFLSIDEAHRILGFKHPAVNDILRQSRSKGGAVMLISQSPNDYMRGDENLLENIGLTICFEANPTPNSLKKVFGEGVKVSQLGKGNCVVRFSGQGKSVQKVKVWG